MRQKGITSVIAILLLGIFLGVKALDYHPLTHGNDNGAVKCELCTISLLHEITSYTGVTNPSVPEVLWSSTEIDPSQYPGLIFVEELGNPLLFGRPPPSLT